MKLSGKNLARHTSHRFAWQGWRMDLPRDWNPVRLQGDWKLGSALFADLHRPRLGIRWSMLKSRRFDAAEWARRAICDEVGPVALNRAKACPVESDQWSGAMLYIEPDPPGRDVWAALSRVSGRVVQVVHHAARREALLSSEIVPALLDQPQDRPTQWAVFDLSCIAPAGMTLRAHVLHAGDLQLEFRDSKRTVSVRQIAVARVALARLPLEGWLRNENRTRGRLYRIVGELQDLKFSGHDNAVTNGIAKRLRRRRRFFFLRRCPKNLLSTALHDEQNDRLILVAGSDESLVGDMIHSIGWAAGGGE